MLGTTRYALLQFVLDKTLVEKVMCIVMVSLETPFAQGDKSVKEVFCLPRRYSASTSTFASVCTSSVQFPAPMNL
jgi:hypothetical protein